MLYKCFVFAGALLTALVCVWVSEYCCTSRAAHRGNIATDGSPKSRRCPTLIEYTHCCAPYNRHHCTLQTFEQFGARENSHDDKHTRRGRCELSIYMLRATVNPDASPGPTSLIGSNTNMNTVVQWQTAVNVFTFNVWGRGLGAVVGAACLESRRSRV